MTAARFATLCLLPLIARPAMAQGGDMPAPYADRIIVGAGGAYLPSYEGSDDYSFTPAAMVQGRISNIAFFTRGTSLFVDILADRNKNGWDLELGPAVNLRRDRHTGIKDDRVKALGRADAAWELGGWTGIAKTGVLTSAYDNLSFRISYLADTGSGHKSYILSPSVEYGTPLSRTSYAGISLSADYAGKGFGRTYYAISPAGAAASGLPAYTVSGSGFRNIRMGGFVMKSLTGDLTGGLSIGAGVSYGRMLGKYKDSPVVSIAGDADQWMGAAGLAYIF